MPVIWCVSFTAGSFCFPCVPYPNRLVDWGRSKQSVVFQIRHKKHAALSILPKRPNNQTIGQSTHTAVTHSSAQFVSLGGNVNELGGVAQELTRSGDDHTPFNTR